jgi:hypothetical protein
MKVSEFKNYLETLFLTHIDIYSFVWGDAFETLQQLLQGKETPLVMVESPDVKMDNTDNVGARRTYLSEIVVLKIASETEKAEAIDETLEIIMELDRKLAEEFQYNVFENYKLTSNFTQVQKDNHSGWRVSFEITFDFSTNTNQNKWST